MHLRHDLNGCTNALQRITARHRADVELLQENWQDARAKRYIENDLPEVVEASRRLLIYLQKAIEFTESISRQTRDDRIEQD